MLTGCDMVRANQWLSCAHLAIGWGGLEWYVMLLSALVFARQYNNQPCNANDRYGFHNAKVQNEVKK